MSTFVLDGLLLIHVAIVRDSRRLAIAASAPLDDATRAQLARWFRKFRRQLDEHHHAEDELFFPQLLARDPALALTGLEHEHRELVALLDRVEAAFVQHDDLAPATAALAKRLAEHIAAEEAITVEATARLMTVDEQRRLEVGLRKKASLSQISFVLPWIISTVPDESRASMLGQLPAPLRWLHRAVWSARYDRLSAVLAR